MKDGIHDDWDGTSYRPGGTGVDVTHPGNRVMDGMRRGCFHSQEMLNKAVAMGMEGSGKVLGLYG